MYIFIFIYIDLVVDNELYHQPFANKPSKRLKKSALVVNPFHFLVVYPFQGV